MYTKSFFNNTDDRKQRAVKGLLIGIGVGLVLGAVFTIFTSTGLSAFLFLLAFAAVAGLIGMAIGLASSCDGCGQSQRNSLAYD